MLRPVSTALIFVAGVSVIKIAIMKAGITFEISSFYQGLNYKAVALMVILAIFNKQIKKHPIIAVIASGLIGIVLQFAV